MKSINIKLIIALWTLVLFSPLYAQDNQFTPEQLKLALVVKIANQITWPESKNTKFTIAVYQDNNIYQQFKAINGRNIAGKVFHVTLVNSLKQLDNVQLLYVDSKYNEKFNDIASQSRKTSTLLISNELKSQHNSMIDLTLIGKRVSFVVNRSNIIYEGLKISPKLLLLGGTELDVAILYRETDNALQQLKSQYQNFQQALTTSQEKLKRAQSELINAREETKSTEQSLINAQHKLKDLDGAISAQTQKIKESERTLKNKNALNEQVSIALAETKEEINKQLKQLSGLEEEVMNKNLQLTAQGEELNTQSEIIETQSSVIYVAIAIAAFIFISLLIIFRFYQQNKKTNIELLSTINLLKTTQKQLVESEKMASLGTLVTGMAHELNTPIGISITAISNIGEQAKTIKKQVNEQALSKTSLDDFIDTVLTTDELLCNNLKRCADLILNFKSVSSDQVVSRPREIILKNYLQEILNTLSIKLSREGVTWAMTGDTTKVFIDPGIVAQIINNLVLNSITHGFEGREDKHIEIKLTEHSDTIEINYRDNGIGMDQDTLNQLYEPFFTTARDKGGTGLGMNIVYNLITTKLEGSIEVKSEPEQGCAVSIKLPKNNH